MTLPLVVAITDATGLILGIERLRVLKELGQPAHLIRSEAAGLNLATETEARLDEVRVPASAGHGDKDVGAAVASGSFPTRGMSMIVARCTTTTLSAIASSFTRHLVVRAAGVQLKAGREPVPMVRETPLHTGHLEPMARAADGGAAILPPMPAFHHRPQTTMELVRQSIGKALAQVGIEHELFRRGSGRPD